MATDDAPESTEPMFGWLLKKKESGWHRGSWQRRFFVLVPRSSTLLYFNKGLNARCVDRERASEGQTAKGSIFLKSAMLMAHVEEPKYPFAFTIVVPGGEYTLSAHSEKGKKEWLSQLNAVATERAGHLLSWTPQSRFCVFEQATLVAQRQSQCAVNQQETCPTVPIVLPPPRSEEKEPVYDRPVSLGADVLADEEPVEEMRPALPHAFSAVMAFSSANADEEASSTTQNPFDSFAEEPPAPQRPPSPPPRPLSPPTPHSPPLPEREEAAVVRQGSSHFAAALTVGGDAAAEHSECAVCFDELHARPVGVLLDSSNGRLCRHLVHYDCLIDLPGQPSPECPMCRRQSAKSEALPPIFDNPRRWFELLDVDRSDVIEADDVLTTLKAQLAVDEQTLDEQWDEIWEEFDLDGSGVLSFAELVAPQKGLLSFLHKFAHRKQEDPAALEEEQMPEPPDIGVDKEAWFGYWDEDRSGFLDEGELLRALVHSLGARGHRQEVQAMRSLVSSVLTACDLDGTGTISRAEFLTADVGLADVIIANLGYFKEQVHDAASTEAPIREPTPVVEEPTVDRNWSLVVRTNGGATYSSEDLGGEINGETTVDALRALVAIAHTERGNGGYNASGLSPDRLRLINRGAALREGEATLASAGVKDGDTLVLVIMATAVNSNNSMSSSSSSNNSYTHNTPTPAHNNYPTPPPNYQPNYQQPPPASNPFYNSPPANRPPAASPQMARSQQPPPPSNPYFTSPPASRPPAASQPQMARCRVTVPGNAGPGSVMTVRAPTGETCRITVPQGHHAGMSFEFQYRAAVAPPPRQQPQYQQQQQQQQQPPPQQPLLTRVTVPPGVQPGSFMTVSVPGRGHHRVVVPRNVYPGMSFDFNVR